MHRGLRHLFQMEQPFREMERGPPKLPHWGPMLLRSPLTEIPCGGEMRLVLTPHPGLEPLMLMTGLG